MKNPILLSLHCVFEKHNTQKNHIETYCSLCPKGIWNATFMQKKRYVFSVLKVLLFFNKQTSTKTYTVSNKTSSITYTNTSTINKQSSTKTYTISKQTSSFKKIKIKRFKKTQLTNKINRIPSTGSRNKNHNTQGLGVGQ